MKFYVGGEELTPENPESIEKFSPLTGKLLYRFPSATRKEANNAIDSAHEALKDGQAKTSKDRNSYLIKAYNLIRERRIQLEEIIVNENGKPLSEAKAEVDGVIDQLWYYIGFERKINGEIIEGDTELRRFCS
ncbi:Aldehyde dehydrogenase domain protein [mine drainage metagenome]|uniref:Aldehyde dehydrogenase domain protein n=1 Tax=mine drainage metagenome TaxID=410659 RepID=T1ARN8_9ZZZZ